jgi:hypothetical protein
MLTPPTRIRADSGRVDSFRCCLRRLFRDSAAMKMEPVGPYETLMYFRLFIPCIFVYVLQ